MASLIAAIIGIDVHDNVFLLCDEELRGFLNAAGFDSGVRAMVNTAGHWGYTVMQEGKPFERYSLVSAYVTVVGECVVNASTAKTRRMFGKFLEALKDRFCYGESDVKVISLTVKKTGEKDNE